MSRRVVITGMGAITPIGLSVEEFWSNVKKGTVGIAPITKFDAKEYKATLAAEVKGFDAKNYMDVKAARRMELFCQYAVAATKEAIENAKLNMEMENPYRVGTSIGSGVGSMQAMEREYTRLLEKGPNRVSPIFIPLMISNMAAGNVAIQFGCKGKSINVVTACATGTNSIGEAYRSIQCGEADVMVAGGTEACITPLSISGFCALTALTTETDPMKASLPFDKNRSGFVMGEGAGIVILESVEHAQARNAQILAEIAGYGTSSDAFHITSPAEDGAGAAYAMTSAIREAGLTPADIDYINAHGTATHHNDLFETRAIKLAFSDQAKNVKVSSTKSMIGHLLGAAGSVELITCVKSIQDGYIHENVGLTETEEEMDLSYVKQGTYQDIYAAISNSLGFGGHNATLLVKKFA